MSERGKKHQHNGDITSGYIMYLYSDYRMIVYVGVCTTTYVLLDVEIPCDGLETCSHFSGHKLLREVLIIKYIIILYYINIIKY